MKPNLPPSLPLNPLVQTWRYVTGPFDFLDELRIPG